MRQVVTPIDPTATGFLLAENRTMPMHVGGLQLFKKPEGAGRSYVREMYEAMRQYDTPDEIAPLFLKHPHRSARTAGQLVWEVDELFDIDHHVRHSALPKPGRVRELLDLVSRLHGTRLAWERPLWEAHLIEGLRDGRVAMYTKTHHALVDGVSAMRLLASVMSTDPDQRGMPAPWALRPSARADKERPQKQRSDAERRSSDVPTAGPPGRARHHGRGRRHARRADPHAAPRDPRRDLVAVPLRTAHDLQPADHRCAPVRRRRLAARAAAGDLQGAPARR